jgi:hypothetical protein
MDISYCYKYCSIGKAKSTMLLNKNDSVFDAAVDFQEFVTKCFETCKYKDKHKHINIDKEK